ncbi:prolyl hydroxylase family protein [Vulcanococcus limneticus]|uniref:prolyl hydroxylase family protein n=1 Tax=Vulcanococcus limneticus TaxID=2170428 RepID=UPI00398BEE46
MPVLLPRFATAPLDLRPTPPALQRALEREYSAMVFEPIQEPSRPDRDYGAAVVHGISSVERSAPQLGYAPISAELMELAYAEITPLIEAWAGCPLERSWGYGIRSYGPGSVLHVHRDRVETHVISCIVHVADRAPQPWLLDFIDHEGERHAVCFEPGTMLFYESLCPHARTQPFAGEYYRNMYFHWRPRQWDPAPYQGMRCKFASLEEAEEECRRMARSRLVATIPATWQEWLRHNRDRGCAREGMIERMQREGGFPRAAIEAVLDQPATEVVPVVAPGLVLNAAANPVAGPSWLQWFEAPLTRPEHRPRAWRLDTPLAQVYELPDLLSRQECEALMGAIDRHLVPSTVTRGERSYRTSRTCHLRGADADLAARLDERLAALFAVDSRLSEPLQGQRYDPGQYFKAHTDWFAPDTEEFMAHTNPGGQRTWTVMIYLNSVARGGQTCFKRLGRCFTPVQGLALAWNNLMADGTPNPFTLHEAMPVEEGSKWVITKWFRAHPGRNE